MFQGDMFPKSKKFSVFEVICMKKKIILRGAVGFPIGVMIGYFISIIISLVYADGYYSPCVPALSEFMGSEIGAVLLQALLCGILGVGFSVSSFIWEIESWSLFKQTAVHFAAISFIMLPIAYVTYWMEHSLKGFLSYFGIFAVIFVFIWIAEYIIGRIIVKKMNGKLKKTQENDK